LYGADTIIQVLIADHDVADCREDSGSDLAPFGANTYQGLLHALAVCTRAAQAGVSRLEGVNHEKPGLAK